MRRPPLAKTQTQEPAPLRAVVPHTTGSNMVAA